MATFAQTAATPGGGIGAIDTAELCARYRAIGMSGQRALRDGTYVADPIPTPGDARWGLSFVLRIEGDVRSALRPELDALSALRRSPHLVYRPDHLHTTIRSLEGFHDHVAADQVEHFADQLRRAVRGLGQVRVAYSGLAGSPGGIFACGYPSQALGHLRERLHEAQLLSGPMAAPGSDAASIRDTAHVSLMVYRTPVVLEPALAEHLAAREHTPFGAMVVRALSLVRYRPTRDSVGLTELARIALPGR